MLGFRSSKDFKNKRVRFPSHTDIEPQEVFLDKLAQKKEFELGISQKRFEVPLSKRILQTFFFLIILVISGLFLKTFQFQVLENDELNAKAQENKFIVRSIQSTRGVVYDSKGKQIVFNKASFNLIINKEKLPSEKIGEQNVIKAVSEIINRDYSEIEEKINSAKNDDVLILENVDHQTLVLLETRINDLPGIEIQEASTRDYKDGEMFAHIVGYTGKINLDELKNNPNAYSSTDYIGREGLEKSYEDYLRKNPGKLQIERDAYGNVLSKEIISLPESGDSLVLWLDADLQVKVIQELQKVLEVIGAKNAAAVAIDPKTGGVLAMASLPLYDNNVFNKGADSAALKTVLQDPLKSLYNRAIAGEYATGSTIKPLTASAALEEDIIAPSRYINCTGKISVPHQYNPDIVYEYNDNSVHGLTDMRKAIAESCNVYFFTIGGGYENQEGLGPSRIKKYLELFGWGNKTNIDLPGESKGFIPTPEWKKEKKKEIWFDGDTYNLSIGQGGIGITPLQVAVSFTAIANNGTLFEPMVVKKIIDSDKNTVEEFQPKIVRQSFIDPQNLEVVREGMRQAVTGQNSPQASSTTLNSLPVEAAAKTGTAETPLPNHYNNWVSVFAPYDDPQIVLTIVFENVERVQAAALPAAKEILSWYFNEGIKE